MKRIISIPVYITYSLPFSDILQEIGELEEMHKKVWHLFSIVLPSKCCADAETLMRNLLQQEEMKTILESLCMEVGFNCGTNVL